MLSVAGILDGTFAVVRQRYLAIAAWIGVYCVGYIALMLAMAPMMQAAMDPATASDPAAVLAATGPVYLLGFVLFLVAIVLYAAAMRAVLRPEESGFAYLRLGMDELRLLGLSILFGIATMVIVMAVMIVLGLFGAGVAMSSQSPLASALIGFVAMIALFGLLLFLTIRFSLAFPLTLHRQRIVVGEAWRLSRGRFWTLFGAALVIALIGMVMNLAVSMLTMGGYIGDLMAAAGNPEATLRAAEAQNASMGRFGPTMILSAIGSAVAAGLWVALSGGSVATAAKLLVDDEDEDAEAIFG